MISSPVQVLYGPPYRLCTWLCTVPIRDSVSSTYVPPYLPYTWLCTAPVVTPVLSLYVTLYYLCERLCTVLVRVFVSTLYVALYRPRTYPRTFPLRVINIYRNLNPDSDLDFTSHSFLNVSNSKTRHSEDSSDSDWMTSSIS